MTAQRLHPGLSFPFRCLRTQPRLSSKKMQVLVRTQFPASLCQGWLLQCFVIYDMTLDGQGSASSTTLKGKGNQS